MSNIVSRDTLYKKKTKKIISPVHNYLVVVGELSTKNCASILTHLHICKTYKMVNTWTNFRKSSPPHKYQEKNQNQAKFIQTTLKLGKFFMILLKILAAGRRT